MAPSQFNGEIVSPLNLDASKAYSRSVVEELKRIRLQKRLSQEQLAGLAGVARTTVTMIESGERNPTLMICHALATALDVSLSEILEKVEEQP